MLPVHDGQAGGLDPTPAATSNQVNSHLFLPALLAKKKGCSLSGGGARAIKEIVRLLAGVGAVTGASLVGGAMGATGQATLYGTPVIAKTWDDNKLALFTADVVAIMSIVFLLLHNFYRCLLKSTNQDPVRGFSLKAKIGLIFILTLLVPPGALLCNKIFDGNLPTDKVLAPAALGALFSLPVTFYAAAALPGPRVQRLLDNFYMQIPR